MLYSLFIYLDERRFQSLPAEEQNRIHRECGAWHQELVRSGHSRSATGLQPSSQSTTLRDRLGRIVVTDGPFSESREVLGGYEVIDCHDLEEARTLASRFPGLAAGCTLELRPHMPGNQCEAPPDPH